MKYSLYIFPKVSNRLHFVVLYLSLRSRLNWFNVKLESYTVYRLSLLLHIILNNIPFIHNIREPIIIYCI